jgi:hypothetical protein
LVAAASVSVSRWGQETRRKSGTQFVKRAERGLVWDYNEKSPASKKEYTVPSQNTSRRLANTMRHRIGGTSAAMGDGLKDAVCPLAELVLE